MTSPSFDSPADGRGPETAVRDVIDHLPQLGASAAHVRQLMGEKLIEHREHVRRHGEDPDEIKDWRWNRCAAAC